MFSLLVCLHKNTPPPCLVLSKFPSYTVFFFFCLEPNLSPDPKVATRGLNVHYNQKIQ